MWWYYLIFAAAGYLLGCSNLAWFLAKIKGVDLASKGSGNPGTSNAVILMGWRLGILVGAHDIGKALLPVVIAKIIFPELPGLAETAGVAAVIGHIFPVFLKFKGGKGFASFVGLMFALDWKFGIAMVVAIVLITVISDYLVIATTVTVIALPVWLAIVADWKWSALIVSAATVVIIFMHRKNYVKIWKKQEIGLRSTIKGEHRVK